MEKQQIIQEINSIFREVFQDNNLDISPETSTGDIEKWDSLTNIELIDRIEKKFNSEFPIDVIYEAKCVGDWVDFLAKSK